jgi:hypothetical protein
VIVSDDIYGNEPMPKKPTDKRIMQALTAKVKSITAGETRPANSSRKPQRIDDVLKAAIRKSGRSYYDLGRAAGVQPSVILRFMTDDPQARGGDIRLSTAARIAAELGLELCGK